LIDKLSHQLFYWINFFRGEGEVKKIILFLVVMFMALPVSAENIVVKQAKKVGVKKCLPAIEAISNFLLGDTTKYGVSSTWSSKNPDKQVFTSVIERNYSDGTVVFNLSVTPTPTGQCYTEYERIWSMNQTCLAYSQGLEGAKYKGQVNKEVAYLNVNGADQYLLPFGQNCIVIKREVIMDGLSLK
jgi:hypothetical protein